MITILNVKEKTATIYYNDVLAIMSNILRENKELIQNQINSSLALNAQYSEYLSGNPTFVIYYQMNTQESKQSESLESVHSLKGANSPVKYNKINNFMVYGVDTLSITTAINDRGLNSVIEGSCIIPPNSIKPSPEDFFCFDLDGVREQLFKIKDVQQDKITPEKFWQVGFELCQDNTAKIFDNVAKEYTMVDGANKTIVMEDSEVVAAEAIQFAMDEVRKRYIATFYDEENDVFTYRDRVTGEYYWSPYLQQFLHNTNCILYSKEAKYLNEIYCLELSEREYPGIYNQTTYLDSIFYAIEKGSPYFDFDMGFMNVVPMNLKDNRNLPFFLSPYTFNIISPVTNKYEAITGNVFVITSNTRAIENFSKVDHYHKVHKVDDAHILRLQQYLKDGDLLYHCPENEIWPEDVFKVKYVDGELYLIDLNLGSFFDSDDDPDEGQELFAFLRSYVRGSLKMDSKLKDYLYSIKCEPTMMNYIFIPLLLHACNEQQRLNIVRKS